MKPDIRDFGRNSFVHTEGLVEKVRKAEKMDNLLKVLDMTGKRQLKKLAYYVQPKPWRHKEDYLEAPCVKCKQDMGTGSYYGRELRYGDCPIPDPITDSLADLAFRLRNEVCKKSCEIYYKALELVYDHRIKDKQCCSFYAFQLYRIQPIDMIIAALIAKEKSNEELNT